MHPCVPQSWGRWGAGPPPLWDQAAAERVTCTAASVSLGLGEAGDGQVEIEG